MPSPATSTTTPTPPPPLSLSPFFHFSFFSSSSPMKTNCSPQRLPDDADAMSKPCNWTHHVVQETSCHRSRCNVCGRAKTIKRALRVQRVQRLAQSKARSTPTHSGSHSGSHDQKLQPSTWLLLSCTHARAQTQPQTQAQTQGTATD